MIFKFKCYICNDVYIGEIKRYFLLREYEHLGKSILTEKNLKYTDKHPTAIRKHFHNHFHRADKCYFLLIKKRC